VIVARSDLERAERALRVGRASRTVPEVAGTLVGFSVVALLSAGDIQTSGDLGSTVLGSGLALGSPECGAAYTAIARRLGWADPLVTTALTGGIGAAVVGVVALPSQDWIRLAHRVCASHRGHRVGWGDRHRLHVRGPELCAPTLTGDRGIAVPLSDSALRAVYLARLARRATDSADAGWSNAGPRWRRVHPGPPVSSAPARQSNREGNCK
jgi:hypothetical protein